MRRTALKAADVEARLRELNGNMAAVARTLGVHRSTVKRFIDQRPKLQEVQADLRESMKDNAESVLYSAVLRGESWAVQFYLKAQAKDRGYSDKHEIEQRSRAEHHHTGEVKATLSIEEELAPYADVLQRVSDSLEEKAIPPVGAPQPVDSAQTDAETSAVPGL